MVEVIIKASLSEDFPRYAKNLPKELLIKHMKRIIRERLELKPTDKVTIEISE